MSRTTTSDALEGVDRRRARLVVVRERRRSFVIVRRSSSVRPFVVRRSSSFVGRRSSSTGDIEWRARRPWTSSRAMWREWCANARRASDETRRATNERRRGELTTKRVIARR